ncbi:unnamed protein product [Vicia faba]|uniref:Uncharacterized protein n=1 Tax=Vicia faba TaxID=3906 RepID=A0AAV0ZQK9_VICFA|nr:unnamed protein product [Vicia faba]
MLGFSVEKITDFGFDVELLLCPIYLLRVVIWPPIMDLLSSRGIASPYWCGGDKCLHLETLVTVQMKYQWLYVCDLGFLMVHLYSIALDHHRINNNNIQRPRGASHGTPPLKLTHRITQLYPRSHALFSFRPIMHPPFLTIRSFQI